MSNMPQEKLGAHEQRLMEQKIAEAPQVSMPPCADEQEAGGSAAEATKQEPVERLATPPAPAARKPAKAARTTAHVKRGKR